MSVIWDSDMELTIAEAEKIINEQFPTLAPVTIEDNGAGWDNKVFLVNQTFIFRFPRRKIAVPFIESERRWLPLVNKLLQSEVPISTPIYHGQPVSSFPYPFVGYPFIQGYSTNERELIVGKRTSLVEDIALFLRKLHHLPLTDFQGLVGDEIGRLAVHHKKREIMQRLQWMENNHIIVSRAPYVEIIQRAINTSLLGKDTLVHGDFYFRNFLIHGDSRLAGVIDFGDIHRGHRAVDLAVAYTFFPSYMRERFFAIYGEIDRETEVFAMYRGLHVMSYLLFYGFDQQDEGIIREAKIGLANLISSH